MPADFQFWADNGIDYLFECKATKQRSLAFSKITKGQIENLLRFNKRHKHVGILAVNFYGENIREKNECYLVRIDRFVEYSIHCGRKSMPEEVAAEIGIRCENVGTTWALPLDQIGDDE